MLNSLRDYSNPSSLGSRFRRKRFRHIEALVRRVLLVKDVCSIIDVGGTQKYWRLMEPELLRRCAVTIVNLEKPIAAARGETPAEVGVFRFECGDGCNLADVEDRQYDIAHSNSVIEHVGRFSDMHRFASELRRVGRYYYLQTPDFWFPIEPHYGVPFVHWLPLPVRARLLASWSIGFNKKFPSLLSAYDYAEFINLIDLGALKSLFPEADYRKEKVLFLTKSIMAVGPRGDVE